MTGTAILRRLTALAVALACTGALASAADAARRDDLPRKRATAHFLVHYGDGTVTAEDARVVAESAERAYGVFVRSWEFPPPLDDGDGRIDIYVYDLPHATVERVERSALQSAAIVHLGSRYARRPDVVAHEVFHVLQMSMFARVSWITEATAEWAGWRVHPRAPSADFLARPEVPLACRQDCGSWALERGYARWTFFEFLARRHGVQIVRALHEHAHEAFLDGFGSADAKVEGLRRALADRGDSLERAYADFAVANARADYLPFGRGAAAALRPTAGVRGAPGPFSATVDRLAARYVFFSPSGTAALACGRATLSLTVTVPLGAEAVPVFVPAARGARPLRLVLSGGRARADVPWSTCLGSPGGTLVLANASEWLDGARFTVTARVLAAPGVPFPVPALRLAGRPAAGAGVRTLVVEVQASAAGGVRLSGTGIVPRIAALRPGRNRITIPLTRPLGRAAPTLTAVPVSRGGEQGRPLTVRAQAR